MKMHYKKEGSVKYFENIPLLLEENVYSAIDSCYYCLVATLCPTLLQPHGL